MNDAEILEKISAEYGDRLEAITPAHKVSLLTRLARKLHGQEPPPVALCRDVNALSPQGMRILMEALVAQLKGEVPQAIAPTHPEEPNQRTITVRATVTYPMAFYPQLDSQITQFGEDAEGRFIGSGADFDRDFAFDFPTLQGAVSPKITRFVARCLSLKHCQVILNVLDDSDDDDDDATEPDVDSTGLAIATGGRN